MFLPSGYLWVYINSPWMFYTCGQSAGQSRRGRNHSEACRRLKEVSQRCTGLATVSIPLAVLHGDTQTNKPLRDLQENIEPIPLTVLHGDTQTNKPLRDLQENIEPIPLADHHGDTQTNKPLKTCRRPKEVSQRCTGLAIVSIPLTVLHGDTQTNKPLKAYTH